MTLCVARNVEVDLDEEETGMVACPRMDEFYYFMRPRGWLPALREAGLTDAWILLLEEMLTYWHRRRTAEIFPSAETLAEATGQTTRNVSRGFQAFKKTGLLQPLYGGNNRDPIHWLVTDKLCDIMGFKE